MVVAVSSAPRNDRALDRGTSGCLVVVVDSAAQRPLGGERTSHIKIECTVAEIQSAFVVNAAAVL